ncbi:MAG: hypothetical protein MJZ16_12680 [Bacteroidales bacterium]|nr:hypothetical protein [Bacteroidales bacterium]
MELRKLITTIIALVCFTALASAQKPKSPEEQQKALFEAIDSQVEKLENQLDLADWQSFKVDSILTHDYQAMQDELQKLSSKKVENFDLYYQVQDKWYEQIYNAYHKILNEEQWAKYHKQGAPREKKARDKRAEQAEKAAAKLKNAEK